VGGKENWLRMARSGTNLSQPEEDWTELVNNNEMTITTEDISHHEEMNILNWK
jgi:hypothetical protein